LLSSSNINPTGSWIGLSTKDQKQDFEKAIKPVDGWKGITPTVANKDKFFALIRQKAVFHNWLNFLNIPSVNSSGTISGNVIKSPTGMETIKFQLINFKHLLDNQQDVTVDNAFLATVQNTIANNINNNIGTPIAGTTAGSSTNPRLLSASPF